MTAGGVREILSPGVVTRSRRGFALLAFPPARAEEGRSLQCCPVVGWADAGTVLFESRHAGARVLAWRVGTPDLYRVSDIRGWTPGEESYVASFAAVDGSVAPDSDQPDETTTGDPDAEFQSPTSGIS